MKVVDLHCDMLSCFRGAELRGERLDFGRNSLHIDLERMRQGDYMLQCFAMYVNLGRDGVPLAAAIEELEQFRRILKEYPDDIRQVFTMKDIRDNRAAGRISALLTIEEGEVCMGSTSVLRHFYEQGVRMMTLTWNFENSLAYPNVRADYPGEADSIHGLKEKGFEFVKEMNRLGIIIDVSHLSDAGFWDVCEASERPFIASHSNARALCGHCRNLTDDMLRAIAERGGVTGLNYYGRFLHPDYKGSAPSRIEDIVRHAEHIRNVAGIDTLALGSDFDGIDGELELYDCSCLPVLERALRKKGFTDNELEKIFSGNFLRVLSEFLPEE